MSPSSHEEQVYDLLRTAKAKFKRFSRGHQIFEVPGVGNWVCPSRGRQSCPRAWKNNLSDLRRKLRVRLEEPFK